MTYNNLKVTPVTRLKLHPKIQRVLAECVSKIEQPYIGCNYGEMIFTSN